MKIHGSDAIGRLGAILDAASKSEPGARKAASPEARADRLEVSAAAREFHAIREAALRTPETRQELVRELREEILDGAYEPDPWAVAQRMLEELGEGLGD